MLLAPFLIAAAVTDAASVLELAPAPGAAPEATLVLAGEPVALDSGGRARVPAPPVLDAPGLRFYTVGDRAFYYPADFALVTWRVTGPDRTGEAQIVAKEHGTETWDTALTATAPVEIADAARHVRFVLPPGQWDLALLVPGWAPAFASDVRVDGAAAGVAPTRLARSARLK